MLLLLFTFESHQFSVIEIVPCNLLLAVNFYILENIERFLVMGAVVGKINNQVNGIILHKLCFRKQTYDKI